MGKFKGNSADRFFQDLKNRSQYQDFIDGKIKILVDPKKDYGISRPTMREQLYNADCGFSSVKKDKLWVYSNFYRKCDICGEETELVVDTKERRVCEDCKDIKWRRDFKDN